MKNDGSLVAFAYPNVPIHKEDGSHGEINNHELYKVELGELNKEGTSFSVRIVMTLGHSGDYLVE